MQENNHLRSVLVFTLLAAISYAVYESRFSNDNSWEFKPFTKGYALFDSQIQITGDDGQINTRIDSPEVVFYADSELTTIKDPIVSFQASDVIWRLTSTEASINSDQSELLFPNDVTMVTLGQEDNATINTSDLTLYPNLKVAKTQAPMEWLQSEMMLTGKGSVIDLNSQEIKVLDEMYAEINR